MSFTIFHKFTKIKNGKIFTLTLKFKFFEKEKSNDILFLTTNHLYQYIF